MGHISDRKISRLPRGVYAQWSWCLLPASINRGEGVREGLLFDASMAALGSSEGWRVWHMAPFEKGGPHFHSATSHGQARAQ
jgi:hypothetical protein